MQINKLLMKNQAYKVAIKKAEAQLKSKAETGDDLQYIVPSSVKLCVNI